MKKWASEKGIAALCFKDFKFACQTSRGRRRAHLMGTPGSTAPSPAPVKVNATLWALCQGKLTTKVGEDYLPTRGMESKMCVYPVILNPFRDRPLGSVLCLVSCAVFT